MTILNWFLIPLFGITGAAIAKLVGYAYVFASYMVISQRLYHVPHAWMPLGMSVAVATALVFCISFIDVGIAMDIALKTVFLIGASLLFMAMGIVRWSEIEKVYMLARKRLSRTA